MQTNIFAVFGAVMLSVVAVTLSKMGFSDLEFGILIIAILTVYAVSAHISPRASFFLMLALALIFPWLTKF